MEHDLNPQCKSNANQTGMLSSANDSDGLLKFNVGRDSFNGRGQGCV